MSYGLSALRSESTVAPSNRAASAGSTKWCFGTWASRLSGLGLIITRTIRPVPECTRAPLGASADPASR